MRAVPTLLSCSAHKQNDKSTCLTMRGVVLFGFLSEIFLTHTSEFLKCVIAIKSDKFPERTGPLMEGDRSPPSPEDLTG